MSSYIYDASSYQIGMPMCSHSLVTSIKRKSKLVSLPTQKFVRPLCYYFDNREL